MRRRRSGSGGGDPQREGRIARILRLALLAATGALALAPPAATAATAAAGCVRTPAGMRALRCPLDGVTVDEVSNLSGLVSAVGHFRVMPTVRIVLDTGATVGSYARAIAALEPHAYLMGELLDSSEETQVSASAEQRRVAAYLGRYGSRVDVWEVGNEVNGNWLGPYSEVAAKLVGAYDQVHAAGRRSALTLFANDLARGHCGDGERELTPAQFTTRYVPLRVRDGVDVALLSWYEQSCGGVRPAAARWDSEFAALHRLYPHALLGFGEVGLERPVSSRTLGYARGMIAYYYRLAIDVPGYLRGSFWWYFTEDAVPWATKPIWSALNAAF